MEQVAEMRGTARRPGIGILQGFAGVTVCRLLKEPVVHFLALALVIFLAYGLISRDEVAPPDRIVVTPSRIEHLALVFGKVRQRPPSPEELKGLVDDYVKEEIYVREAMALGLDEDDTVIRRRLRYKMEFLNAAPAETVIPTDSELQAYMEANGQMFEIEPTIALRQIYLNPQVHGERTENVAGALLETLRGAAEIDPQTLGDPTLLPPELPLGRKEAIAQVFGEEFVSELDGATTGLWNGPVRSGFGWHLVLVTERKSGRLPALSEVRDAVTREWLNVKRIELEEQRFAEFLKRYEVIIETQVADLR